jgi:glyoxylase-like metal-dependent hydrolase (beta-lactamase superfamily II)
MAFLDRLHRLSIPTPFPVGPVNLYLLEGSPLTLIDCGPNWPDAYHALVSGLQALGYQLRDLEQLIITHHHIDHLGMAGRIVEESGAQIVAHRRCAPYLETPPQTRERFRRFFDQLAHANGIPAEMLATQERGYTWLHQFSTPPVKVKRALEEGDWVEAGDVRWRVYHTPGHAGDLICLYEPNEHILLASDHLILTISSNPLVEPPEVEGEPRPHRLPQYIHHLQRIAALDIRVAYSGHGEPVSDVAGLVAERVALHRKRADHILSFFNGDAYHLWDVTEKLFGHIALHEKFLAISEALGHLDLLEDEGKLARETRDGTQFWQRAPQAQPSIG